MTNIIEYGVSATLQAEFEMLRDTLSIREYQEKQASKTETIHQYKYATKTIDKLAQYLLCRNYGKACLELAYLCWPIVRHQEHSKGLLHFFWIEEAITPTHFRHSIAPLTKLNSCAPLVSLNEMGMLIRSAKQTFTISASRVMLLSALLELLVSNIQGTLEDIESHLSTSDEKCVGKLASYLQKKLYEFLKPHLPTANLQQKYRYIHQWVNENCGKEKLNDNAVLKFWTSSIDEEGYVKFESALVDIIDYQFAYEQVDVSRKIAHGQTDLPIVGADNSADEDEQNSAAWLYDAVFEANGEILTPPTWLVDQPKFVTKKEYAYVALLFELRQSATQFPLSVMRTEVFGRWQNAIIQHGRDKNVVVIDEPHQDYAMYLQLLDSWRKQAANTLLSCAAILYEQKDARCLTVLSQGVGLLVERKEKAEFRKMLQRLFDINKKETGKIELTFTHISRWLLQSPTLNNFFGLARKALAKNNRAGFKNNNDYHAADIYEQGAEQIVQGAKLVHDLNEAVLKQIENKNQQFGSLEAIFRSDLFIFKSELVKRHGLKHE
jgi:hypothetical protein